MSRLVHSSMLIAALAALIACAPAARAQSIVPDLEQEIRQRAAQIEEKLIAWRRDIHEHPELGEQETRTAAPVAEHLRKLGLEVKTGVANTGVVALWNSDWGFPFRIPFAAIDSYHRRADAAWLDLSELPPATGGAAGAGPVTASLKK